MRSDVQHTRVYRLPGFRINALMATAFLGAFVILPVIALLTKSVAMGPHYFWDIVTDSRAVATYRVTLTSAFFATLFNTFFGVLMAWILVRYEFPGRMLLDGLVDLPFALPTSVSGLALATLFSSKGWLGGPLQILHLKIAFAPPGIALAMAFTSLPFVIRAVQPVLRSVDADVEEAAAQLGAGAFTIFRRVILPAILPAILVGATLAMARGIGEYGAVIFIAGNLPYKTEITALLAYIHLDEFDYAGSAAIATVMLVGAFAIMLLIGVLERWAKRFAQS
jgi:sulfate/thiosulfate transport system permease protein